MMTRKEIQKASRRDLEEEYEERIAQNSIQEIPGFYESSVDEIREYLIEETEEDQEK